MTGHLFQTKCLGTELQVIVLFLSPRSVFVFDRVGGIAVELDNISFTDQPESVRPQWQRTLYAYPFLNSPFRLIDLFMHHMPM